MFRRYVLLWLILTSGVGALWPQLVPESWGDPFLATKPWIGYLIALTMFCVGAVLPAHELREVARRWPQVLGGTCVQYISMPLLAWLLTLLFHLPEDIETGILLVGCVPGAMASNVLTMVARGNVSYSVGLTTSATLLSPLMVPLVLRLTMGATATPALLLNGALLLSVQVVIPTIVGFVLSQCWRPFGRFAERWAGELASAAIVWIIAFVVAANRQHLTQLSGQLAFALLALNLLGFLAGALGGRVLRLPDAMRRALILEIGMQNAGVGASLATMLFPLREQVSLPCGLFAFGCMATGTLLAQIFAGRPLPIEAQADLEPTEPPRTSGSESASAESTASIPS